MPHYRSYIADKNGPIFFWDNIPNEKISGNLPDRLVPPEWHENLGFNYFWINEQIESGAFLGKQLDWGAWGIEVTKADALAIWEGCKDDYPHANWKARWAKIKSQIEALDVGKQYVIVVAEEP